MATPAEVLSSDGAAVRSVHVEPAALHAVVEILEEVLAAEQRSDDALPYWDAALSIVRDADEEAPALSDEIESLLGSEASILAAYWRGVRGEG